MLTTSQPSEDRLRMSTLAYAHFATRDPSAPRPWYGLWDGRTFAGMVGAPDRVAVPSTSVPEAVYVQAPRVQAQSSARAPPLPYTSTPSHWQPRSQEENLSSDGGEFYTPRRIPSMQQPSRPVSAPVSREAAVSYALHGQAPRPTPRVRVVDDVRLRDADRIQYARDVRDANVGCSERREEKPRALPRRVKQSTSFVPPAPVPAIQPVGLGDRFEGRRRSTRDAETQTDSSSSSWDPRDTRPRRSSSNTSYRDFATGTGSQRRDERKVQNDGTRGRKREPMSRTDVVKVLAKSEVDKFTGNEASGEALEFLQSLDEVVVEERLADDEILCAVSSVLRKGARVWWRASRDMIKTWDDFKTQFKRMYLTEVDEEDLWEDLRRRTQGEREKVSAYLTSLRYIAMQFRHKPKVDRVVYRAYRNLRPEYRRAFAGRIPITLDEIEEWGIQFEKMKDLDCRWEAPPNAENMHVPGAACQKPVTRGKGRAAAAAVSERSEGEHAVEAAGEWQTASGKKGKKKGKGKGNSTAGTSGDEQLAATVQTNSAQYGAAASKLEAATE